MTPGNIADLCIGARWIEICHRQPPYHQMWYNIESQFCSELRFAPIAHRLMRARP
jgi:hypothetical protein